jgi:hypothetical protein
VRVNPDDDLDEAFQRLLNEESGHSRPGRGELAAAPTGFPIIRVPDHLANTPPAVVAVPTTDLPNLSGRRAIFSMAKGDVWRSDIRVISGPHTSEAYDGRPWAWVIDEGSWYRLDGRLPDDESGLHCVPLARLWVEEYMTMPPEESSIDLGPSEQGNRPHPSRYPGARPPWPPTPGMEQWPAPRVPIRAPQADSVTGHRVVVATSGGYHRDLRAVSEPFAVPATGGLVVALMHERDWYLRWDRVLDAYPVECVWVE